VDIHRGSHFADLNQQMGLDATPPDATPTPHRPRVWQDSAAESLLAIAVAIIALTGVNSFVLWLNLWLASAIPSYDPMVTMLALVVVAIAALITASIRLKIAARGAREATRVLRPLRPRGVGAEGTTSYSHLVSGEAPPAPSRAQT
jgi:hypothetical protein